MRPGLGWVGRRPTGVAGVLSAGAFAGVVAPEAIVVEESDLDDAARQTFPPEILARSEELALLRRSRDAARGTMLRIVKFNCRRLHINLGRLGRARWHWWL